MNCFLFAIVVIESIVDLEMNAVAIKYLLPPSSAFIDFEKPPVSGCDRTYQFVANLFHVAFVDVRMMVLIVHIRKKEMKVFVSKVLRIASSTEKDIVNIWMFNNP